MSRENVDRLRAFLQTWSGEAWTTERVQQGEIMDLSLLDPDVVYEDTVLPDHVGEAYRGHEGVLRATQRWVEPFEWLVVELTEILEIRDRLVSVHQARSKARHTGIEFDASLAYLWTFRDGRVVHFKSFWDPGQAIEAAGLME
jgi:ketosteroid isomerase-like protein